MKQVVLFFTLFLSAALGAQNPVMLKDVYPGATGSSISEIVKTSNYTFFTAEDDDPDSERGLYRTDGTPGGTVKLNLTYPALDGQQGYISTRAEWLIPLGDKVVFAGDNFEGYNEMWSSDGTQAGTIALERFLPTNGHKIARWSIAAMGGYVYYGVVSTDGHIQLRKTDGTREGTSLVKDFGLTTTSDFEVALLNVINNTLYFDVYQSDGTDNLWKSDGTEAGTQLVKAFPAGQGMASYFMPAGNSFYFFVGATGASVLWKSDGTTAGTMALKTIGTAPNSNVYPHFANIGSTLYFAANDNVNGRELWKTDGTEAGTVMVSDINPGAAESRPQSLTVFNNKLYFSAVSAATGRELYWSSGSGATLVKDIFPGATGSIATLPTSVSTPNIVVSNNTLLFSANNGVSGAELWISDGTNLNTRQVADINPSGAATPTLMTPGSQVYFSASNGVDGAELYTYDNARGLNGITYQTLYVNDNSTAGDVFTSVVGNDANPGTPDAPLATLSNAVELAGAGYVIMVDAGTYTEQVTITKALTVKGAGTTLTTIELPAAGWIAAPSSDANFHEYGVIQTVDNIDDVTIRDLAVDGKNIVIPNGPVWGILSQTGGLIFRCEAHNTANNGIFVRYPGSIPRTVNVSENYIHHFNYVGIDLQGTALTALSNNNRIDGTGGAYVMGYIAGGDFGPLPSLILFSNDISNYNGWGVLANSVSPIVVQNSFVGSGPAIQSNSPVAVNGTCNWYGAADGLVVASKITGNVNYSPWLVNGTDANAAAIGFQPTDGACTGRLLYVNDNSTAGDQYTTATGNDNNSGTKSLPFATIGKALQVAGAGDVIYIDAGTYTEQLIITRPITLKGAGAGVTTIRMPDAMNLSFMSGTIPTYAVLYGTGLAKVTLQDLAVDGGNKNFNSGRLYGIALLNTGGEISGCAVRNFRNTNTNQYTNSSGTPVYINVGQGAAPRSFSLHHNVIKDYYFYGIYLVGSGLTVDVHDNEVTGNGVPNFAQYGITLYYGTGQIYNNTVSNMVEYTATNDIEAAGITLGGTVNTSVYHNRIINCEAGFIINGGNPAIRGNEITASKLYGIEAYALGTANAALTIENNTIDNQQTGVFVFNEGTGAVQATLSGNSITHSITSALVSNNAAVTATCNWYDASSAQAVAATITGNVLYTPWLTNGADSDPAIGFQPAADACNGTPPVVTVDALTNATCYGASNGTVNISVTGGGAPYTYAWTRDGDASFSSDVEDPGSLAAGTYQLTLTDAFGSMATAEVTLTQPTPLIATVSGTSTACSNSATVAASGGTGDYTYLWSNGATTANITNIAAATYTVTVTDAAGCRATGDVTLTGKEAFNPSAAATDVTCNGAKNGSITVTNVNGAAPFRYSIDGTTYQGSNVFSGLAAGTYTVTVIDANGCTGFVTKTISQPSVLTVELNAVQSTCSEQSTGSVNVTVGGGAGAYAYSWSGPNGFVSTHEDLTGIAAGDYTLTVTDKNGCSAQVSATVSSFNAIIISPVIQPVSCKGAANGSIDLTVNGGTGSGFLYNWNIGTTTQDVSGLSAGNYTVAITDQGSGCALNQTYTITQPATALSLSVAKTNATGCSSMGTIVATGSGGTALYKYSLDGSTFQDAGTFGNLPGGNYTVWVKDAQGCTASKAVAITDNGSDQYESNNSKNQAKLVAIGDNISARIALATDVADWFRITTPAGGGNYVVSLTHPTVNYTLQLYPAGNNAAALVPVSATAYSKEYVLAGGTSYYISITGGLSYACYTLNVSAPAVTRTAISKEAVAEQPKPGALQVRAFPNPSAMQFSVVAETGSSQPLSLRILDTQGRLLETRTHVLPNRPFTLGSSYRPGIYYLEVQQGQERKILKLVKQSL